MNNSNKKIILIIDDSLDNQELLTLLLEAKGYQVFCASNGQTALDLLGELTSLPDLILLDAQMPIMDGYQFRLEQSKNRRLRSIPVVVMTGESSFETNERMNHPQAIMSKPLQVNSLMKNILSYL